MDSFDVKVPLTLLKNALSLAGKFNQSINQLRRNFIKPSLPVPCARLADIADDSSEHLFGDSITDSLESLKKEKQIKALLRKVPDILGKRKHSFPQQPSNFKASCKTLKRTQDQGHYVRRSNQSQNHNNYNYNRPAVQRRTPSTKAPAGNQRNTDFFPKYIEGKKI